MPLSLAITLPAVVFPYLYIKLRLFKMVLTARAPPYESLVSIWNLVVVPVVLRSVWFRVQQFGVCWAIQICRATLDYRLDHSLCKGHLVPNFVSKGQLGLPLWFPYFVISAVSLHDSNYYERSYRF